MWTCRSRCLSMPLFHLPSPPVPHLRLMNSILSRSLLSRTPSLLTNSRALSSRTTFPTTSSIFTHPPFVAQPPRSRSLSFSPFTTAVMPVQTLPTPPPKTVKLALCQIHVTAEKDANIATAIEAVTEAADHGASIVVLPEMWNCPYANASFPIFAEDIEHGPAPSSGILAMLAKARGITIIGGSIPERKGDKLFNTCCVFGPNGALLAKHRKTHLFDIDIPGKMTFKESDTLTGGEALTVVESQGVRIGLGICFDMRFPEMAMLYARKGVQLIVYPGAFNMVTGPLHWELLQRARALDNQLFVATCSPARDTSASYVAYGNSMVIGPFAEVLCRAEAAPTIVYADLDLAQIEERRRMIPLMEQRRSDLYNLTEGPY